MLSDLSNWIVGVFVLLLGALFPVAPTPTYTPAPKPEMLQVKPMPAEPPAEATAIPVPVTNLALRMINDTRVSLGLVALSEAGDLNGSAANKCTHMVANDYWAHDGAGRVWSSFISDGYNTKGEILARGFEGNPSGRHQAWLNSPTHYAVIVIPNLRYFGTATCQYNHPLPNKELTVVHFGG